MKLVIDKMTERSAAEASKRKIVDGGVSAKRVPGSEGGGTASNGDEGVDSLPESPATLWAKEIPVLPLKMESRACGLLAAWVQATVVLVEAFSRAREL